jgi:alpha-tubulin suppressor-like RCC1 family protein
MGHSKVLVRAVLLVGLSWVFAPSPLRAASAKAVAVSEALHTCAVTTAGGVKCWGYNNAGQLGDGTTTDRLTPTDTSGLSSGVVAVSAGSNHTCALTSAGGVKCWGDNSRGQLGDGTNTRRTTPVDVAGLTSNVASIAVGRTHTCALTTGGGLKCWGYNSSGQVGDGTTTDRWTPVDVTGLTSGVAAVDAGWYQTCAVMTGGGVRCWGLNGYGQLGDGTTTTRTTPVDVSGLTSGVSAVTVGTNDTCALTTGGGVKCWGWNTEGSAGDGTTTTRLTPVDVSGLTSGVAAVAVGENYACALTTGGGVKCWGYNLVGQLGDGGTTSHRTPADVPDLTSGNLAISAGHYATCALTAGRGVRCWGDNYMGQLGVGTEAWTSTPIDVPGLASGQGAAAAGASHTCALATGGGLKCWGDNSGGQLGDGTLATRYAPTDVSGLTSGATAVTAGSYHTCALTAAGGVKCWGANDHGQLGDGTSTARSTPVDVSGLSSGVTAVAAGGRHTCALTTGGGVKCWGENSSGQVGDASGADRYTPVDVSGLTSGAVAVTAGLLHTCAVTAGGAARCWGDNGNGQVGDGTLTARSTPVDVSGLTGGVASIAAGDNHTCAVTTGAGLKCWGHNSFGQLGDGTTTARTTPVDVSGLTSGVGSVAAGGGHTCAVTSGGDGKCWGRSWSGQVGDGTTAGRSTPVSVVGLAGSLASVTAGQFHTCAVTTGGGVKCWGHGSNGQLGDRRYASSVTPVRTHGFGHADFDADDKVDLAVYRPSSGTWFSLDSSTGNATYRYRGWGVQAQNDAPVVGDFDGDGINDPTVFRPASGTWFVLESHANYTTWRYFGWGASTDVLVPGDYDGDGITDAAIYRPSEGRWYVRPSSGGTSWTLSFGNSTDTPIAGDFDGDGKRDPAVYRASTGTWFWLKSSTNFTTYDYKGWGVSAQDDAPAPGDYDGDGKTDPCVFRPATGTWFVLQSSTNYTTMSFFGWGAAGDTLVPADYDGDGRTDGAIYRASTGTWYIKPSSGATEWSSVFGNGTDVVLVTMR